MLVQLVNLNGGVAVVITSQYLLLGIKMYPSLNYLNVTNVHLNLFVSFIFDHLVESTHLGSFLLNLAAVFKELTFIF